MCLNREVGLAKAGKIIRFIRGKSIVVFHCSAGFVARLLQSAVLLYYSALLPGFHFVSSVPKALWVVTYAMNNNKKIKKH